MEVDCDMNKLENSRFTCRKPYNYGSVSSNCPQQKTGTNSEEKINKLARMKNGFKICINLMFGLTNPVKICNTLALNVISFLFFLFLRLVLKRRENKTPCSFQRTGLWNQVIQVFRVLFCVHGLR